MYGDTYQLGITEGSAGRQVEAQIHKDQALSNNKRIRREITLKKTHQKDRDRNSRRGSAFR